MATTVAIDWSGALNPLGKIWLALAHDGELAELEPAPTREYAIDWLLGRLEVYPTAIAGIDFAFSMPRWFVESHGVSSAIEFWKVVERCGENWLQECEHPFWGKRNSRRPDEDEWELYRQTERDVKKKLSESRTQVRLSDRWSGPGRHRFNPGNAVPFEDS